MRNLLKVRKLTVGFEFDNEVKYAVNNVDLDVYDNDFVGLVGESGCGKSVLAQTILGIQSPSAHIVSGSIKLNSHEVLGLSEKEWSHYRAKQIATVFQEPMTALNPLMKVGRQIEEVLKIHYKLSKAEMVKIVYETMEKVGLKDPKYLYNQYPHQLSGGMQQRIIIAMALIANPKILIADEPTTALDATTQMQILKLFKEIETIYNGGIIFISHDLKLVSRICKRIIVMYAGKIVEQGPTDDIINRPKHPYTKGLLKAIPSYKKRGSALYTIPGHVPALKDRLNYGCPFADRCEFAFDRCYKSFPMIDSEKDHKVACYLYEESHE